jgi:hypothetical protein
METRPRPHVTSQGNRRNAPENREVEESSGKHRSGGTLRKTQRWRNTLEHKGVEECSRKQE